MSKDPLPSDQTETGPATDQTDEGFLADYYGHVTADDLLAYSSDTLARWADYHRAAARVRAPGHAVVEVRREADSTLAVIVAEDVPYLLQSVTASLARQDAALRLLVHPAFRVLRDPATHELLDLRHGAAREGLASAYPALQPAAAVSERPARRGPHPEGGHVAELWIAAEIGTTPSSLTPDGLQRTLARVVDDVLTVAADTGGIQRDVTRAAEQVAAMRDAAQEDLARSAGDALEMLRWLAAGNFVFLGSQSPGQHGSSGRGLLRRANGAPSLPPDWPGGPVLSVRTSDFRSTVLRSSYLDEVGVRVLAASGDVAADHRFVGFFVQAPSDASILGVPGLREKVAGVVAQAGPPSSTAAGEALRALGALPHDELFQRDADELARFARDVHVLEVRHRTRLFLRHVPEDRFMSALLFLPRGRYSTGVRLRVEQVLRRDLDANDIEFDVRLAEGSMARVFFRILLPRRGLPAAFDAAALERRVVEATRTWEEGVEEALRDVYPADDAARLARQWAAAFPAGYRADYDTDDALRDIARFESLGLDASGEGGRAADELFLKVYVGSELAPWRGEIARIRVYLTSPYTLTDLLPFFHNLGLEVLDQRPYTLVRGPAAVTPESHARELYLYDLGLRYPGGVDPVATSALLVDSLRAGLRGDTESDRFDSLALREAIDWRRVVILRAYAKYLKQLGTTTSYGFMADTLLTNPEATRWLLGLFAARFDPDIDDHDRLARIEEARQRLAAAIDSVPSLDADRLLRTYSALIEATLRTNFYQFRPHVSLKLNPGALAFAPSPRPAYEIWVYSPRVEGVHLRFGPVARGGLRWSDRREDFRTEVLGLARAQTVKNAVIVPTGAKGAFYPKRLPDPAAGRAEWLAEGVEGYRTFIRGLLDVTDNLAPDGRTVIPPPRVVRHDGDDSYLVVAADKGTASFSDVANELAAEYGFWLGDAFASGGSVGYDHKRMGITARGAWESVKSHFAELGVDVQHEDFTVAGIGDMSGDVFGNGMLLSHHIRLVAAFDHRHIFLDPDPDPAASYRERHRLFRLPRSSWSDYDDDLISEGGGVYFRSAKSIELSPQARAALGLPTTAAVLSPPELVRAILRAPVDLLYNGGIGTYVKASSETHLGVGDKGNDAVRVDAPELRARVVAEGGNLGLTQLARVEAAQAGVLLNTDAIDNSAGVDCSDHEVNIKVFTDRMIAAGRLDPAERAPFLHSLSDEVSRLVLRTNSKQNVLLLDDRQFAARSQSFERAMEWLESAGGLDRGLEGLPGASALDARLRAGRGLTSPELSVLAAHAKIALAAELTVSDLADDPWLDCVLAGYFPAQLSDRFAAEMGSHPLRREIVGTVMANEMINLGGITFAFRVREETAVTTAAIARAFLVVRDGFGLGEIADSVAALPPSFPRENASETAVHFRRLLDRGVRWYVTHDHRDQPVGQAYGRIAPTLELLRDHVSDYLRGSDLERAWARLEHFRGLGLPDRLALRASDCLESFGLLDISLIAETVPEPIPTIADVYYAVLKWIDAARILLLITDLPRHERWEALARAALRDDVYTAVADMTTRVMQATPANPLPHHPGSSAEARIAAWEAGHGEQLRRIRETIGEVTRQGEPDIEAISVALKLLRTLLRN
ncbi:NAD-glutamate dehydrogenase [Sinomonas cyclohexanicum]|uniref:NAD-glutamate dehydrogenase n=1 Tax=Sinomonas cyclohexanicum TaxID=322009 RepID=A0ABN6FNR1_SINCY|nr:NAD-glutamate dehydrogenase domain-containing protein [Corynebacterium cyclohexanicum]BCT77950.1 NAD-glutamate dehydrogenase [Corynebacterium cyclohexanicum]